MASIDLCPSLPTLKPSAFSASSSERTRVEMVGSFMVLSMSGKAFVIALMPSAKPFLV